MKRLLPLLGLVVCGTLCAACVYGQVAAPTPGGNGDSTRMEYDVIALVLERFKYDPKRMLIFDDILKPCSARVRVGTDGTGLSKLELEEVFNDCASKENAKVDGTQLRRAIRPIPESDYRSFFDQRGCEIGWKAFYTKYPKSQGYVRFSRVGFNKDKNFALVEFSYVKECLDGEGHLFLMRRNSDGWKIVSETSVWMF